MRMMLGVAIVGAVSAATWGPPAPLPEEAMALEAVEVMWKAGDIDAVPCLVSPSEEAEAPFLRKS